MSVSRKSRLFLAALAATLTLGIAAGPASAQQTGLVNVNIEDNVVQVPVAVAANICDVNVAVLVRRLRETGESTCDAVADSEADAITPANGGGGGAGSQQGLVNVNVEGNTVQVPIAVAANVCDVNVAVLVGLVDDEGASCDADASAVARSRPGGPPA